MMFERIEAESRGEEEEEEEEEEEKDLRREERTRGYESGNDLSARSPHFAGRTFFAFLAISGLT